MKPSFFLLAALVVLTSCQSAKVKVEYNTNVDFFKYRTFNWLPGKVAKDDKQFQSIKSQNIKNTIADILLEKQLTKSDKPDLLVAVNVTEKEKVYYTSRPNFYGYHRWGYYGFRTYEPEYYTVSTLFIAFIEPETKKAVWEGSVQDWQYNSMSDEKMKELLRAVLDKYPPMATDAYQEVK